MLSSFALPPMRENIGEWPPCSSGLRLSYTVNRSCRSLHVVFLVAMSSRVILGADHQTATLFRTTVDRLDDVDQFLFVFEYPFDLVVVTGAEIDHHVFISEEAVCHCKPVSSCLLFSLPEPHETKAQMASLTT